MSYTSAIVEALLKAAKADTISAKETGAMEVAAGYWQRAFSSAECNVPWVTQHALGHIGRSLCRDGEALFYIDMVQRSPTNSAIVLRPVVRHNITGQADPSTWRYEIQLNTPSTQSVNLNVGWHQIVHCMYSYKTEQPWIGIAPLTWCIDAALAMGMSEVRTKEESGATTGYVLPIPEQPESDVQDPLNPLTKLTNQIRDLEGQLALVESMQGGWGGGTQSNPRNEWEPIRLGANPPATLLQMRRDLQDVILAACGLPPTLARGEGESSQGNREAWRQFLHGTISPIAYTVQEELSVKLNTDVQLNFERLFASDLQGRARSFQSMVQSGMDLVQAAALSGLMLPDGETIKREPPKEPEGNGGQPVNSTA